MEQLGHLTHIILEDTRIGKIDNSDDTFEEEVEALSVDIYNDVVYIEQKNPDDSKFPEDLIMMTKKQVAELIDIFRLYKLL